MEEFWACIKKGYFETIIGVFDPDKPLEDDDSFNIDLFEVCDFIIITGDIKMVEKNVKKFCKIFK